MWYNCRKMTKQKLWLKKRTTRGAGRKTNGKTKMTPKNLSREIYKNQHWYSHFLLKFVICAGLGIIWIQVGFAINIAGHEVSIFPIGAVIGLIVLAFERVVKYRFVELAILIVAAAASFLWPIGIVL